MRQTSFAWLYVLGAFWFAFAVALMVIGGDGHTQMIIANVYFAASFLANKDMK